MKHPSVRITININTTFGTFSSWGKKLKNSTAMQFKVGNMRKKCQAIKTNQINEQNNHNNKNKSEKKE